MSIAFRYILKLIGLKGQYKSHRTPRARRIDLQKRNSNFHFKTKSLGVLSIHNLSWTGIGLQLDAMGEELQQGSLIVGQLVVAGRPIEIEAKVVHIEGGVLGCKFLSQPEGFRDLLVTCFEAEYRAKKLNRLSPKHIKSVEAKGNIQVYYGGQSEEFYFTAEKGKITHFHILYMGNYIEGGHEMALQGMKKGQEERLGITGSSVCFLRKTHFNTKLDAELLQEASSFVHNISNLRDWQRAQILAFLCPAKLDSLAA